MLSDSGYFFAKTYCASCHLFPDPALLDKHTWEKQVLPGMGYRFGIYSGLDRDSLLEKGVAGKMVNAAGIFPAKQVISDEKWAAIKQYYSDHAPEKLNTQTRAVSDSPVLFEPVFPEFKLARPAITALSFDEISETLLLSDCSLENHSTIHIFNKHLKLITTLGLPHPIANMTFRRDTLYILMMGHLIPSDEPAGSLLKAIKDANGNYKGYTQVLKHLKRPVDVAYADLDCDGDEDILVCEYGNHTGGLSLFMKENNKYKKRVLQDGAGPIRVIIQDMNQDSYKDIVLLTAQGDERIDILFNNGKGKFSEKRVLRFPPVYGSVSFSLCDMNGDGFQDIVYVNGDNADLSPSLKPYHGVRVFLNDQFNRFSEFFFFPMHGAYKACVKDFDLDEDLDIAAIAFFPDFENHPEQGFIYLENKSVNNTADFVASTFPGSAKGRWITMEGNDIDNDGDADLILGSFTSMEIPKDSAGLKIGKLRNYSPSFIFLRNTTR